MAPEVITEGASYSFKADIWSLGVSCLECFQDPPYMNMIPLRALFAIASDGLPPFQNPERMSKSVQQFIQQCTQMDPDKRPTAETLLNVTLFSKNCSLFTCSTV